MMDKPILSQLNVFPVKSLGGVSLASTRLTDRGLEYDRRWMLVDESGRFLTQREHPQLALLKTVFHAGHIEIAHQHEPSEKLQIPLEITSGSPQQITIWRDQCTGLLAPAEFNLWFSEVLNTDCRLVYMPEHCERLVDQDYRKSQERVSFADGFPCLIIGQASLDDLNGRLAKPVGMDRFRTNLVFQGGSAFIEDQWQEIVIGEVRFRVVKPCPRCTLTTVDPNTGIKQVEPLRTLATYRKEADGGVMFGQNLIPLNTGEICVGTPVEVIS